MAHDPALHAKVDTLPESPGVYLLKDVRGDVLYVGKAVRLRSRVRSYFHERVDDERRLLPFLLSKVVDVEVLEVATEKEALLLENSLIKRHKPRYNVRLIDDKTYLSLRLDRRHRFPRFTTTRRRRADSARYFGPYSSARSIRATLKLVYRAFGIRSCSDSVLANRTRPCLYHQIGQCLAPCVGLVTDSDYARALTQAELLLDGRSQELLSELHGSMARAAEEERFEEAATLRDRIRAVQRSTENQDMNLALDHDFDIVGHGECDQRHAFVWLHARDGRVVDTATVRVENRGLEPVPKLLLSVLMRAYDHRTPPGQILVAADPADRVTLEQILSERRGGRVAVSVPSRGAKRRLLAIATKNAVAHAGAASSGGERKGNKMLGELQELLELPQPPRRIDCFDISHLGGTLTVGAMAVARDGELHPGSYRRYRLRGDVAGDDFAALREVLSRRLSRGIDEADLPDLLMLDGGAGQLAIGRSVQEELGVEDLPIMAFAKGPDRGAGRELILLPGREPIALPTDDPRLHFLQRLRDESHRFAISYQRRLRRQRDIRSLLDDIPGIGPRRRKALLERFGSVAALRRATANELSSTDGIGVVATRRILSHLHTEPPRAEAPVAISEPKRKRRASTPGGQRS